MADVVITVEGPLFDGRAEDILEQMCHAIQDTVADEALVKWETNLEERIRHSGPVYQRYPQVKDEDTARVVNDGWGETNELPYGPWLEGIGSRNAPVTIFEGYHSLEEAFEATKEEAGELAEPVVDEYVRKVNSE